jgi:RNA polymerase sigma factor
MSECKRSDMIKKYMPFIIKTIADFTGRYVEIENSDELGVAMEAFNRSVDLYSKNRGNFYMFSKKVIINSLIDLKRKEKKNKIIELDERHPAKESVEKDVLYNEDIKMFEKELSRFNIDYELLIKKAPKHKDTRKEVIESGVLLYKDNKVVNHLYEKGRLPLKYIENTYGKSMNKLKKHKIMIIAIIIVYSKKITSISDWIESA